MPGTIDARLAELGIELPQPSAPGANYVPFVRTGNLVFLTGQLSQWNGERRFLGKLGREFGLAEGQQAARLCALNLIAHLRVAVGGDLDRVTQAAFGQRESRASKRGSPCRLSRAGSMRPRATVRRRRLSAAFSSEVRAASTSPRRA